MSREIRRVPIDWEHPRQRCHHSPWKGGCDDSLANGGECYASLYDQTWAEAMAEYRRDPADYDNMPPNPLYYRPDFGETATAFQVYETVSEGSPVSPVFETEDALLDWLVNDGSGLGIGGSKMPLTREQAERFVHDTYAPSMIYSNATGFVSGLEL